MTKSYEIINYNLRPAKSAERKIIIERIIENSKDDTISDYQYIGFGSIYFKDFIMMHKSLNITKMLSIEKDYGNKTRFEFNKPFKTIDIEYEPSSKVLPKLEYETKCIIWLDYDSRLKRDMLEDIRTIVRSMKVNSYFIITCNCDNSRWVEENKYNLQKFENDFQEDTLFEISDKDLTSKIFYLTISKMFQSTVNNILKKRNAAKDDDEKLEMKKLFHFLYRDNAQMLTFGGKLVKLKQQNNNSDNNSNNSDSDEPEKIKIPNLTCKEINLINEFLPDSEDNLINSPCLDFIPEKLLKNYFNTYRHYPHYYEIDNI